MIRIDLEAGWVETDGPDGARRLALGTAEAFAVLSRAWLRGGWDTRYVYGFTWLGRPIIQLPEDLVRVQEVIYSVRPDVLVETGIAHGGSLVFYAGLFKAMGGGRVIGVDIEIRPHNRAAIERHELFPLIDLVEGDSASPAVVSQVKGKIRHGERVMVMLDSRHTRAHVLAELRAYSALVSIGLYIVAADGIMADLAGAPRSADDWTWNNPKAAALQFVAENPDFAIEEPAFPFNEGAITERVTYWPGAFIRRQR